MLFPECYDEAVPYIAGEQLPFTPHAIRAGTTGTLVCTDQKGNVSTWTVAAGETIRFRAVAIASGSTAGAIILLRYSPNTVVSAYAPDPGDGVGVVTFGGVDVTHNGENVTHG